MYTFDGRIRYSEVDRKRALTVEKLIDYFQDCSSFQSEDLDGSNQQAENGQPADSTQQQEVVPQRQAATRHKATQKTNY